MVHLSAHGQFLSLFLEKKVIRAIASDLSRTESF